MPYIEVKVTGALTDAQKNAIKRGLGEKIGLIPNKKESAIKTKASSLA